MDTPKALLKFDGKTCLELILNKLSNLDLGKIYVVLGSVHEKIQKEVNLKNANIVINENFNIGQTSSLKVGVNALPFDLDGFLLFLVDMPFVEISTIRRIASLWQGQDKPIAVPVYEGKKGHPVIFGKSIIQEIKDLKDGEPAHNIIRKKPSRILEVEVKDSFVIMKMNTKDEYMKHVKK
jgi:molybdenum cofactor cytidylyltransferase